MSTYQERVSKGAKLLDDKGPANWRSLINMTTFSVGYSHRCIIGQLFLPWHGCNGCTAFANVCAELGMATLQERVEHGFDFLDWDSEEELGQAWLDELDAVPA